MTLVEFLLARIAEDEALARKALDARRRPWVALAHTAEAWSVDRGKHEVLVYKSASANGGANGHILRTDQAHDAALADYVVSWQPDRVLAECEAKRRIVADCTRIDRSVDDGEWSMGYSDANYSALCSLALPYASHPDYRQEWAL